MPIDATTPLYKQTPTGGYVKYDPLTGRYSLVAASRVPPLMRLSIPAAPAKKPGLSRRLLRKILMMAMLEVQQKANDAGDPQSAVPLLAKLSAMLRDPGAAKSLRLSWVAQTSKSGHLKAVGQDIHAGRTLYGKQAESALRAQQQLTPRDDLTGGKLTRQKNIVEGIEHQHEYGQKVQAANKAVRGILDRISKNEHAPEDLEALATHLPYLPRQRLAYARQLLGAQLGGGRKRDAIVASVSQKAFELATGIKDERKVEADLAEPMEATKGLPAHEAEQEQAAQVHARKNRRAITQKYLAENATPDDAGGHKSIVMNTDEWRHHLPGYVGTNAHVVHEGAGWLNKKAYAEALQSQKGKGNGRLLILAGGGGSGKGTATKQFFDQREYPLVLDQVSDNLKKLEQKIDEAKAHGFQPSYTFIDRPAEAAWGGVVGRAKHLRESGGLARTVPLDRALHGNIEARKVALELLRKRDDVDPRIIDNTSGEAGKRNLITDRAEAIAYLEKRVAEEDAIMAGGLRDRAHAGVLKDMQDGGLHEDIAAGLVGKEAVENHKNAVAKANTLKGEGETDADGSRVPEQEPVPADQPAEVEPARPAHAGRGEPRRTGGDGAAPEAADGRAAADSGGTEAEARGSAPRGVEDYVSQAMANLRKTSRTAAGVVDTSASKGKADQIVAGLSGADAAKHAVTNFEVAVRDAHDAAQNPHIIKDWASAISFGDRLNQQINKGIVKEGVLHRKDDSTKFPYTSIANLNVARRQFGQELADRLNDPKADPVETAAWIEWRANLTDHFWADGVGKTAKALAMIPLMRAGLPLPEYPDNKEFFKYSQKAAYDPHKGGDAYLDASWEKFRDFYKGLMPRPSDAGLDGKKGEEGEKSAKVGKEPHEMTAEEFHDQAAAKLPDSHWNRFSADGRSNQSKFRESATLAHQQHVGEALAAGKPVPPEVLADYPDLAAKHGKAAPVAESNPEEAKHLAALESRGKATSGRTTASVTPHPAGGYAVELHHSNGDGTAQRETLPEQHADIDAAQKAAAKHLASAPAVAPEPAPSLFDEPAAEKPKYHVLDVKTSKHVPVEGKRAELPGFPDHEFFTHKDGSGYRLHESRSGMSVHGYSSPTEKGAVEEASSYLAAKKATPAKMHELVEKSVSKNGLSPYHAQPAGNPLDNERTRDTKLEGQAAQGTRHDELDRAGTGDSEGRVSAQQPVGREVASAPGAASSGAREGAGQGTRQLPDRAGQPRTGADGASNIAGDDAGRSPAARAERTAAHAARRDEPDASVGDVGGRGRLVAGADQLPPVSGGEVGYTEAPSRQNPTDVTGHANYAYPDREFFKGGLKAKFNANVEAIKTLRAIQAEGRTHATPEEQAILSRFTGWGQFPAVFDDYGRNDWDESQKWKKERAVLKELLPADDWAAAAKSTLNAHYTHPDIVDAHWKAAEQLGFKGGRFLETSAGVGYYLGMMPGHIAAKTKATAVELDQTPGAMLGLLYPKAHVAVEGFEKHQSPDNYYDLVASNVPFGDYKLNEQKYNKHDAYIHDHFFLKSADLARPGGLVMHITSTGTLDKIDPKIRKELAKTCDLVSAIRFPGNAHAENAGTAVVTDMVILRKRHPGEAPGDQSWLDTASVPDPDGGEPITVNKYFADHPEQILGRLDRSGEMRAADQKNVSALTAEELSKHLGKPVKYVKRDDSDRYTSAANKKGSFLYEDGSRVESEHIKEASQKVFQEKMQAAIARLPKDLFQPATTPKERLSPKAMPAPRTVKNGGYHVEGGKLHVREGGALVERTAKPEDVRRIQAHLEVRDANRAVVNAELAGEDAEPARKHLNAVYDQFVKKYGPLHARPNRAVFDTDPDSPTILGLEKYDKATKSVAKSDRFRKTTISAYADATHADSVQDGLGISLHEKGGVDVAHIARLTGQHPDAVGRELVEKGLAFEHPSEGWQHGDIYLSGNVRDKLVKARAAAANDPKFAPNVAALEKVQPADIHHTEITPRLGAHWIPPKDIAAFAGACVGGHAGHFHVTYNAHDGGEWSVAFTKDGRYVKDGRAAEAWGAGVYDKGFHNVLEAALNNKTIKIYTGTGDAKALDHEATKAIGAKVQELKDKFKEWVWTDDGRRERLHRHYNDNFNNIRAMQYNGQHLKLPGKNPDMEVRDHVKNFVWQVVTTGKGLAGHEVGTGKTRAMIASAMELRRLGLARKPAIACLKANIEGITEEARQLYPGAKILSTADMFDAKKRKETVARMATGDYDMVIMTHDHLNLLPMKPENQRRFIQDELDQLIEAKVAAEADGDKVRTKDLENAKAKLEAKLSKATDESKKDDAIYFEESGIDHLFVDEAQQFKTLPCYTKMENMKGIPTGRSERATNMLMRTRHLMEKNNGRGVVFATGTPISNSIPELYTMQRYLQPEELKQRGIHNFDDWANLFGETTANVEPTVTGEFKVTNRFAKFVNVPELLQISRQVIDVRRADDIKNREKFTTEADAQAHAAKMPPLKKAKVEQNEDGTFTVTSQAIIRPDRKDHMVAAPNSPELDKFMLSLIDRAKSLDPNKKHEDNMLTICTDGRKAAIDLRMLNPNAPDDPNSKVNHMVRNVLKNWKDDPASVQAIFSDLGTNPIDPSRKGANEVPDEYEEESPEDRAEADAAVSGGTPGKFHLYGEIIRKLVAGGIPREQIADFSKLDGVKKEQAQQACREGKILIALGSTQKLGTGVNIQDKLKHMHHLDAPWRPADIEQRNGRGWRQGNRHPEVHVHTYVTEKSLDAFNWGVLARKAAFIKQAMSTDISGIGREVTEMDTTQMSPEHLMAAATGNPYVLEKVQIDDDVKNLEAAHRRHEAEQTRLKGSLKGAAAQVEKSIQDAESAKKNAAVIEKNPTTWVEVGDSRFDEKSKPGDARDALRKAVESAPRRGWSPTPIGTYRGFRMIAVPHHDHMGNASNEIRTYLETESGWRSPFAVDGDNPMGSLAGAFNRIRREADAADEQIARAKSDHEQIQKQIGAPFAKSDDYLKKLRRQKELEAMLTTPVESHPPEDDE